MQLVKGRQLGTQAEYARHRQCSREAVRRAVDAGRIPTVEVDGRSLIDFEVADILWAQNTRARIDSRAPAPQAGAAAAPPASEAPAADLASPDAQEPRANSVATGGGGGAPAEPGYHEYRTRQAKADAERAERENLRDAGKLIERDATERAVFDAFRALRDATMAAPQRAAAKVVGMGDAREIERVISAELRLAFDGWEQGMLAKLPARDGA